MKRRIRKCCGEKLFSLILLFNFAGSCNDIYHTYTVRRRWSTEETLTDKTEENNCVGTAATYEESGRGTTT